MATQIQAPVLRDGLSAREHDTDFDRRSRLTIREVGLAWIALCILGGLAYAPHIRHGGFYYDDWANAANALYPPGHRSFGEALSVFSSVTIYRPGLVVYVPLTYFVLGTHMAYQLAWATALAIAASVMLYGILRTLGVPVVHAWLIAALTLVYPWSDATRLWVNGSQVTLSLDFTLAGVWLAIEGLRRRSWPMHCCAAILYLLSLLTYEVTLPVIASAGLLYVFLTDWRTARSRWAVDIGLVMAGALWVGSHTTRTASGVSGSISHLGEIISGGGDILGRTLLPTYEPHTALALVILLTVVSAGVVVSRRMPEIRGLSWSLRGWVLLAFAGIAVAVLGWIMFIPANPYYTPVIWGLTNRVNGLAGFGLVMFVYADIAIGATLLVHFLPRARRLFAAGSVVLGLLLGFAYVHVLERHIRVWNAAYQAEMAGIGEMRMQFPRLPHGTTVFTSDYPAYETLGVPIFSSDWDVNGMIRVQYKDGTLAAYPVFPGQHLACHANGVGLEGPGAPPALAAYGSARFLDVATGQHARPRNRRECIAAVVSYTPGPLYLSLTY